MGRIWEEGGREREMNMIKIYSMKFSNTKTSEAEQTQYLLVEKYQRYIETNWKSPQWPNVKQFM